MIDLTTPNEWQHKDESLGGILFPWYTKSFLDELVTWDLKDKVVFEYGLGASTLWWNEKCNRLCGVESSHEYYSAVCRNVEDNNELLFESKRALFPGTIGSFTIKFDIIIVDCEPVEWRDDCIENAIRYLKPRGKLIVDNWDQPSVWVPNMETRKLLAPFWKTLFKQDGHTDWQTAVFTK